VNSHCSTETTRAPRDLGTAAVLFDATARQNRVVEDSQNVSPEMAQPRHQPVAKTFNPSSYFPKNVSKLVSLR
jgi:hypothetical protein